MIESGSGECFEGSVVTPEDAGVNEFKTDTASDSGW
jgi:hypothetical protein